MVLGALAYRGFWTPVLDPEVRVLRRFVPPGGTVLDIGAGVGLYAFPLARLVGPAGHVLAVEPYAPSADRLERAALWLGVRQLELLRLGLSDTDGAATLAVPSSPSGRIFDQNAHVAGSATEAGTSVRVMTLDRLLDSHPLDRLDFVKCDVEGYESAVFRGGAATIRRFRPVILCEIEERWCRRYGVGADEVLEQIRALGNYRAAVLRRGQLQPVSNTSPAVNDYFLLP